MQGNIVEIIGAVVDVEAGPRKAPEEFKARGVY